MVGIGYHIRRSSEPPIQEELTNELCHLAERTYGYPVVPAIQLFLRGPRNFAKAHSDMELESLANCAREKSEMVVVHGAFPDIPWDIKPRHAALRNIATELFAAEQYHFRGVIIHLNEHATPPIIRKVIADIAALLRQMRAKRNGGRVVLPLCDIVLWLELAPRALSHETGHWEIPEQLATIAAAASETTKAWNEFQIGLCIDTAHLWASGNAELSRGTSATTALDAISSAWREAAGATAPIMMHLNDAEYSVGSGRDKHANLMMGAMWQDARAEAGLRDTIKWAQKNVEMIICETPAERKDNDVDYVLANLEALPSRMRKLELAQRN